MDFRMQDRMELKAEVDSTSQTYVARHPHPPSPCAPSAIDSHTSLATMG